MDITLASIDDSETIANIVSTSNKDVAQMFNINKDNNPKHPSFYHKDWVVSDFDKGEIYFLYKEGDEVVGCVAFEPRDTQVGYLNRLSVLPSHQKRGTGEKLVKHIFQYAKGSGMTDVSIGIIAKHTVLKNWYIGLGFVEKGMKEFPHLPFDVLFMKCHLDDLSNR